MRRATTPSSGSRHRLRIVVFDLDVHIVVVIVVVVVEVIVVEVIIEVIVEVVVVVVFVTGYPQGPVDGIGERLRGSTGPCAPLLQALGQQRQCIPNRDAVVMERLEPNSSIRRVL